MFITEVVSQFVYELVRFCSVSVELCGGAPHEAGILVCWGHGWCRWRVGDSGVSSRVSSSSGVAPSSSGVASSSGLLPPPLGLLPPPPGLLLGCRFIAVSSFFCTEAAILGLVVVVADKLHL
jgi:hypothetical protein